jgi:aspartate dehydrogenase
LFEGPPEDACRAFPSTSNVAASLQLAAGKSVEIRVRIIAVPGGTANVHEIQAAGDFGRFRIVLETVPSPANPHTSRLAALSAAVTLEEIIRTQKMRV